MYWFGKKNNPMPRNRDRRYVQDLEFAIWAVKKGKWVFNRREEGYKRSVYRYPLVSKREKRAGGHKTQKSLALMEDIILTHTNPGQLILDPFMGSGTTGLAALRQGRSFLGVEREIFHYNEMVLPGFQDEVAQFTKIES